MTSAALIVAAGAGHRAASGALLPKQYAPLGGQPMLAHALRAFCEHAAVDLVVTVIDPAHAGHYASCLTGLTSAKLMAPVAGGSTRQASVLAGLRSLREQGVTRVLIHDAARPFIDQATIGAVLAALDGTTGAIAALPVTDTLKRAGADGSIAETVDRGGLWRAQTPQGFAFEALLGAHEAAAAAGSFDFTDDAAIAEWAGLKVTLVPGPASNTKITTAEDLAMAQQALTAGLEPRTGTGFDVHRFKQGDHVWLCGVKIAHDKALEGHSDADVGLHALTDAILGALGDGDIGQHFPPSDERWRGASSHLFVEDAVRRLRERGGRIVNADVTLLCEAPKIGPHRGAMQAAIGALLAVDAGRVGVKATTTEGLGFTGRREGIAAMAAVMLLLPP